MNNAEELERYDLFKKSKARVAKLNSLNTGPVFGTTSMMDFSQVVYDRLSDENRKNECRFEFTCSVSSEKGMSVRPLEKDVFVAPVHCVFVLLEHSCMRAVVSCYS